MPPLNHDIDAPFLEKAEAELPRLSSCCRLMIWFTPGAAILRHQKVVAHLVLTDDAHGIFSDRERHLLLSIGGTTAPSRRQFWALRELSRMAARLDLGGSLDS
ncbi:hypothetical protein [Reyranella soli]|uniref:Uncharacterized protein n=1 Tax=Reyranella soli TaxID=1230389 RepID=A0A512NEF5_9HYPH|nr:hypothetical protein [Reyranella soli]GEP57337.1 hypothetical protein RSO01_45030 [Reyranella soli]